MMLVRSLLPVILLLAACQRGTSDQRVSRIEAIAVADNHMVVNLPQVPRNMLRAEVVDEGANWRVDYVPPEGWTGLTTVRVNKRSGRVVGFVIHQ